MKKFLCLFLALLIATAGLMAVTASAVSSDGETATGEEQYGLDGLAVMADGDMIEVFAGDVVTYEFVLDLEDRLTAVSGQLFYDADGLELIEVEFPVLGESVVYNLLDGRFKYDFVSVKGKSFADGRVLVRATFEVIADSGVYEINNFVNDLYVYGEVPLVENCETIEDYAWSSSLDAPDHPGVDPTVIPTANPGTEPGQDALADKWMLVVYCAALGNDDYAHNIELEFDSATGSLTYWFPNDTYVFLRNYNTGVQYCTDGWQGFDANPCVFVNQNSASVFEKMFIPAGEQTLTLTYSDATDSCVLRYDTVAPATEAPVTEVPMTLTAPTDAPVTEAPTFPATEGTEVPMTTVTPTDVPVTEAPETNRYYLVGSFNEWSNSEEYELTLNTSAEVDDEYRITVYLNEGSELKIHSDSDAWYPDGMSKNYVVSKDGLYNIYFRPNGNGYDDWYYGWFYVTSAEGETPTQAPTSFEPATQAPTAVEPVTEVAVTETPVTEVPATDTPVTEAPETDSYYLVGSFNEWSNREEYKLALNTSAEVDDEYYITVYLNEGSELKIHSDSDAWYPDGMSKNYVVSKDGLYNIYFRPNGNGYDDWYYGWFYVTSAEGETPTQAPTSFEPATQAPTAVEPVTEVAVTETPVTEVPATDTPGTEAPVTQAPATQAPTQIVVEPTVAPTEPVTEPYIPTQPVTEPYIPTQPVTEPYIPTQPVTEVAVTEAPATQAPATEAPVTEAPTQPAEPTQPVTEAPTEAPTQVSPDYTFYLTGSIANWEALDKFAMEPALDDEGNLVYIYELDLYSGDSVKVCTADGKWFPDGFGTELVTTISGKYRVNFYYTDDSNWSLDPQLLEAFAVPTEAPQPTEAPVVPTDAPLPTIAPTEAPTEAPQPTAAPTEAPEPTETPIVITTDPATGVSVITDDTVQLIVTKVDMKSFGRLLSDADANAEVYSVTMLKRGMIWLPDEPITVTIPKIAGAKGVVAISADGTVTELESGSNSRVFSVQTDGADYLAVIFTDEPVSSYELGDADLDHEVSILDATCIQRGLVGLNDLSDLQWLLADADRDGEASILDATAIQRWLVGLPNTYRSVK